MHLRRHSLRRTIVRVLVVIFILFNTLDVLHIRQRLARKESVPGSGSAASTERIFIASIFWNNEAILRSSWNAALIALVEHLGPSNVYISIHESGSWDATKDALRELDEALERVGVERTITTSNVTHLNEISVAPEGEGWVQTPQGHKELRRIPYLAKQRNIGLKPLEDLSKRGIEFDKMLFVNDVVFSTEDVLRLLNTNDGVYAAACSMDFKHPPYFYDTFALRDLNGDEHLMPTWPYFRSRESRIAMEANLPVPVSSCWNGMVVLGIMLPEEALMVAGHADFEERNVTRDIPNAPRACKPEWMDGGAKQEEMAERLKREVREKAHHRQNIGGERGVDIDTDGAITNLAPAANGLLNFITHNYGRTESTPTTSPPQLERVADCVLTNKLQREKITFGRSSDTILLMFYLEHVVPFLFPFYRPTPFEGGKAWLLEMMISSPVVRQATLCQGSFFFSLGRDTNNDELIWQTVLTQTAEAFETLRNALQYIGGTNITDHMHGTVRILASVMQVQRFEVAVLSFDNCRAHLTAALALFEQLMSTSGSEIADPKSRFECVMSRLGPTSWLLPGRSIEIQSAEQAAFRFSTALLLFDDVVASTIFQEPPRLYDYHNVLLQATDGRAPVIDLEHVVGCQNWVLLIVSDASRLDAWKQRHLRAGDLDIMELVRCATPIKASLETQLHAIETRSVHHRERGNTLIDQSCPLANANQSAIVTRIWGHAALVYLSVVVSGWQPASIEVHYHVESILDILDMQIYPPALLRAVVWPFCVAGCLAIPSQEARFRAHMEALDPPSVFGALRKAFKIMENAWKSRETGDTAKREIAACFRDEGDLVLLV
ncbi:hypothetical protein N0V90_001866 [Kalmusia sp. IMI 367209]|nr:hypothetical protein N0V90_001866 [Kalmusia sp. IMI 367209]